LPRDRLLAAYRPYHAVVVPETSLQPVIRVANADDADELARLRWEMSAEFREPTESERSFLNRSASEMRRNLEEGDWTIWVAVDPGDAHRLIGNACLQQVAKVARPYPRPTHWGYVTNVYVDPAWRNRGLGQQLMEVLIGAARTDGLDTLLLWPSERAVPLYERLGFAPATSALELPLSPE
jgi:GNAT superfamily N-acetyltransferase